VKPKYPLVPAGAAAPADSCSDNHPPGVLVPDAPVPFTPEPAPDVAYDPRPVIGAPGDPVLDVEVGTATFEAYAVPVAVEVAIEYEPLVLPKMVNDAVLAEDAAGSNCQNFKLETVYATPFVKSPLIQTGYEAEPALTGFAV
jgi:hypothetical protein